MSFSAKPYQNRLLDVNYPKRSEFEKTYFYKEGKCVAVKKNDDYYYPESFELIEDKDIHDVLFKTVREHSFDQETYKIYRDMTFREEDKIMDEFKEAVLEYFGIPKSYTRREVLFEKARSLAPSSLQSIANMVGELSDLVPDTN